MAGDIDGALAVLDRLCENPVMQAGHHLARGQLRARLGQRVAAGEETRTRCVPAKSLAPTSVAA